LIAMAMARVVSNIWSSMPYRHPAMARWCSGVPAANRAVLGTMTFGWEQSSCEVSTPEVHEQMNIATNLFGVTEVDTARIYSQGRSEELLGKWFTSQSTDHWALRPTLKIATKAHPGGSQYGLSEKGIREQVEASLQALQLTSVDTLYLHSPDQKVALVDSLAAVNALGSEGKVRSLGMSNYAAWEVVHAVYLCQKHGWPLRPTIVQGMYDPMTRAVEDELLPACKELGIRFLAYNPLAAGLLTGKHQNFDKPCGAGLRGRFVNNPNYMSRYWKEASFNVLAQLQAQCNQHGLSMTAVAFRWLLEHSQLQREDGILVGASSSTQLKENLDIISNSHQHGPLPDDILTTFESLWEASKCDAPCYFRGVSNVPGSDKVGYVVK